MLKKIKIICISFLIVFSPVISFADDCIEDCDISFDSSFESDSSPIVNARHAIVLDRNSSTVLFGKNEKERCKMASTTKIMTAIIVLENCNDLQQIVTVSKKAAQTQGSRLGLSTNDSITVENLLYGLLMVSGNDAAVCLAEFIGSDISHFASMMNQKASDLNLANTHFVSPHGLDSDEHYTTAYDLAVLSNYALKNDTFSKIVNTSNYTISINSSCKNLHNTNELLGSLNGVYGIKTGFTNGANRCLVTACKRNDLDIICVVLGCDTKKDRTRDSVNLINYIFDNFSVVNIVDKLSVNFSEYIQYQNPKFQIIKGISSDLALDYDENQLPYTYIALDNSVSDKITFLYKINTSYTAPLNINTKIGSIDCYVNNNYCFSVDILSKNNIDRKDVYFYLNYFFKNLLTFF